MTSQQPVFESPASCYDSSYKSWKTGTFALTNKALHFNCDESESIIIPLTTIAGLDKKQSSFIYASIVVTVASDKFWFASFFNRDSVYNLVELFWREALLSKEHKTVSPGPKAGSTNLGKDLLNLLHESETTLVNAANSLTDQGSQIEEIQATVDDINTDLTVAEKYIKNMSLTQSLLQLTNNSKPLDRQEQPKCFKVTFCESLNEKCFWEVGRLLVSENISLVDGNRTQKFSVKYDEIISVEVISSWKMCLKFSIKDAEKCCYIMCPNLEKLLRRSFSSIKGKIFYSAGNYFAPNLPSASTGSGSSFHSESTLLPGGNILSENEQVQVSETMISDKDIQEISSILNNLQDLASEINREKISQIEKIESLMSNVERTELRMKADSKKIKKLT